jgi:hypothetical protein
MNRAASFLAIAGAVLGLWAGAAGAASPIRSHQHFNGLVNGSSGSATIGMACFGPIQPGQTGHPFSGQTVAVTRSSTGPGYTGEANTIRARLFWSSSGTTSSALLASFRYYDQPAAISTALDLPCAGSGKVVFRPLNGGTDARVAVVKVNFVGQP